MHPIWPTSRRFIFIFFVANSVKKFTLSYIWTFGLELNMFVHVSTYFYESSNRNSQDSML